MTEREAWLLLATHLEAIGMPWDADGDTISGLCGCVDMMNNEELISDHTWRRMDARLNRATSKSSCFLEIPYAAKPRVKWCLKFAEEAR